MRAEDAVLRKARHREAAWLCSHEELTGEISEVWLRCLEKTKEQVRVGTENPSLLRSSLPRCLSKGHRCWRKKLHGVYSLFPLSAGLLGTALCAGIIAEKGS